MKTAAKRIQRKRTKGWTMPTNAVYVGRGSKWGNPVRLIGDMLYIDASYRRKYLDKYIILNTHGTIEMCLNYYLMLVDDRYHVDMMNKDLIHWKQHFQSLDVRELRGHDLACWCNLSDKCHADILLELANK